jgi:hypothetical protein
MVVEAAPLVVLVPVVDVARVVLAVVDAIAEEEEQEEPVQGRHWEYPIALR